MIVWVDAQLSPKLATWIAETFSVEAHSVRDLGLIHARDRYIYLAARDAGAIVLTKDSDFRVLLDHLGPPPQIIWITCGNTSEIRLREILEPALLTAFKLLNQGESLVEISDALR